jgi:signal transduction histidine kinase
MAHRILPGEKYCFETVCPFRVDGKKYLLRVCFKIKSIQRLELHLMRRLVLQGAVFVFIILIIVLYFINIHSNRLLAREHDNMMAEVERIQQQLRQQERTAAMGQLAAGVAHEIRNPLNAIQILTQRIEREIQPGEADREKFMQFTRVIREEIKRLNEIIKQFLNFTSIKHPEFKKCNPLDIAKDIVLLENGVAHQKEINIKLKINKKPILIKADCYLLKQALVNVIKNAIEATPEYGKITVSIFQNNKTTDFIIEDTGVGMNEEEREKAFDLYFSTKNHGTGLGLAITRRIVDQHNGEIIIQSEELNGTVIIIRIPNRRENEFIGN